MSSFFPFFLCFSSYKVSCYGRDHFAHICACHDDRRILLKSYKATSLAWRFFILQVAMDICRTGDIDQPCCWKGQLQVIAGGILNFIYVAWLWNFTVQYEIFIWQRVVGICKHIRCPLHLSGMLTICPHMSDKFESWLNRLAVSLFKGTSLSGLMREDRKMRTNTHRPDDPLCLI